MKGQSGAQQGDDASALVRLRGAFERAARSGNVPSLLRGLLTSAERQMLSRRLHVAQLLASGWSFQLIVNETGVSTHTIAAVNRWLKRENPRYRPVVTLRLRARDRRRKHRGPYPDTRRLRLPLPPGLVRSILGPEA